MKDRDTLKGRRPERRYCGTCKATTFTEVKEIIVAWGTEEVDVCKDCGARRSRQNPRPIGW